MGRPLLNYTGQRFGRLVVTSFERVNKRTIATCVCDCGTSKKVPAHNLRRGCTASCGCLRHDTEANVVHGHTRWTTINGKRICLMSPAYHSWMAMRTRCGDKASKRYGARGIRVCDRWQKFENFLADMGHRPAGKTIDRIDNDGHYEPSNCRWATAREQRHNQSPR